ncbi:MAG: metallopeptidase TldD-related protein [Candidatus Moduliflexus flocculans]|nr:metallopeptidase TldD-related protein [Candidatus Moduliflexus flocculans]
MLIADSNGRIVEDLQPMTRARPLRASPSRTGKREQNGYNVAGARRLRVLHARAARPGGAARRSPAPPILFEAGTAAGRRDAGGARPPAPPASSSTRPSATAWRPTSTARASRIYSDKIGKPVAAALRQHRRRRHAAPARAAPSTWTTRATPAGTTDARRERRPRHLPARRHLGAATTASRPPATAGARATSYAPLPRMRSTYMLPGPAPEGGDHRLGEEGHLLPRTSRTARCSIGAGDFTFYVKNGYLIEDGKLTRPIKDVNIIGNGPKVLEKVDMVADDLAIDEGGWTCGKDGQSVPVSQGMPTVRVASITVGGARKG